MDSSISSPYLFQVSGMNCQIPQALESESASFLSQLSATAKYLKSSGTQASLSSFSIVGKYKDSLLW